jgi:hypothetical protein
MATIVSLKLSDEQPEINRNGNTRTTSQNWVLIMTDRTNPIDADIVLYSLGLSNQYGFPSLAGTPLGTTGLLSGAYKTKRSDGSSERAGYLFRITVNYSNNSNLSAMSEDPVDASPMYRSENVRKEVEITIDPITKLLLASTNGQLVFPRFTKNRILKRWIIVRNERNYNDTRSQNTIEKINSDSMGINGNTYVPRSLLLESWEGDPQFDAEGNEYFVCTYKILVDVEELHRVSFLDVSTERDLDGNLPPNAIPGKAVTQPAKLDGNGLYLDAAGQKDPAQYSLLLSWVNEETPFSFLGFNGRSRGGLNIGTISRRLGSVNLGTIAGRL